MCLLSATEDQGRWRKYGKLIFTFLFIFLRKATPFVLFQHTIGLNVEAPLWGNLLKLPLGSMMFT